jgi:hypothetical protein
MSTDAAVQAQLAEQAAAVQGTPSVPDLDLSKAAPVTVDIDALAKQLADLQAKIEAADVASSPVPAPPDDSLVPGNNWGADLIDFARKVETRLHAVEVAAGLAKDVAEDL